MNNYRMLQASFVAISILFILLSTTTSFAASSGGISIVPYYGPTEQKRAWFIYTDVKPKTIINDKIVITNLEKTPIDLWIYPVDAETAADGGYAPKPDDAEKKDVGQWTTLAVPEITIKPGEQKIIPLTIRIPEKVGIGDHGGTILIKKKIPEKVPNPNAKEDDKKAESMISVVTRIGVRIYITIAGPLTKKLFFDNIAFHKDAAGKPFFYFSLANEGNVRLSPKGIVEIYDTENKLLESIDANLREIFPYSETIVPVAWEKQRSGTFIAKGSIPDPANDKLRLVASTKFEWTIPKIPTPIEINSTLQQLVIGAGIIIFVLFAVVMLLMLTLRRKKK